MIYKIASGLLLFIIVMVVGIYFIKPELFDTESVFYDKFYSGLELTTRLENREVAQFPKILGRFALYGPTDKGVGISVDRDCRFSDPSICSKMYRLEYRDFKGSVYFVNISKFKEGKTYEDIRKHISSLAQSSEDNFFRFEKHEIGWISKEKSSFIIIQKGVCQTINNQPETCSYPNRISTDDEVVSIFNSQFPMSVIAVRGQNNDVTKENQRIDAETQLSNSHVSDELGIDDYNQIVDNDNPKRMIFAVKNTEIRGENYTTFAAMIWKENGAEYEVVILFGDGEENMIAHWTPQMFNESISHQYSKAGTYIASLVLVPRTEITKDVEQREIKIGSLPSLTVIKKITLVVDEDGKSKIIK